jgi:hypothetical protein
MGYLKSLAPKLTGTNKLTMKTTETFAVYVLRMVRSWNLKTAKALETFYRRVVSVVPQNFLAIAILMYQIRSSVHTALSWT